LFSTLWGTSGALRQRPFSFRIRAANGGALQQAFDTFMGFFDEHPKGV
jgi:hypothetical protein